MLFANSLAKTDYYVYNYNIILVSGMDSHTRESEAQMVFHIGDRIAHPLHGAGIIDRIETRKINGEEREYYILQLPAGDMLVMVPVETCQAIGVRPILESDEAERLMQAIPDMEVCVTQNWNKRYRENMLKIRSGDLLEVATVMKGLIERERERGLSTGERKMLHSAKQIFITEIMLSVNESYEEIEARIDRSVAYC